jgi:small nuclear ribonucleoprotein
MESNKRPLKSLMKNINNVIQVRLKNDIEYKGRMVQCDAYMNIIMDHAVESKGGEPTANYGYIFIRGNNILYITVQST